MSAPRLLGLAVAVPLLAVGLVPAASAAPSDDAEGPAPAQLIELTTDAGDATAVAEAGLDDVDASATSTPSTQAPASTSGGSAVAPQRATILAADVSDPVDPEADAALLTEPLAVDDFLVAGFTWEGGAALPAGTQIYLRVREDGVWSPWYLNQAADAGRDDGVGRYGTDEFVTGGADAIQASVVGDPASLPTDLNLALVPGEPTGTEVVDGGDLDVVDAEPTAVQADATATSSPLGPIATAAPSEAAAADAGTTVPATGETAQAPASTTGGSAVSPTASTLLAAATTANGLPVPVITRAEWGADESVMEWTPSYYEADHVVVHHTAGTNSYTKAQSASIVNGIYNYHAVQLGWGDIGYHFLVDKYGQVFEGRTGGLASAPGRMSDGGHALGVNNGSMGISMMGDYSSVAPTTAQLTAVGRMAGWFLGRQGIANASGSSSFIMGSPASPIKYPNGSTQNFTYIFAHRDVNYTTCPGNVGYSQMGTIRSVAQQTMSATARTWVQSGSTWYLRDASGTRLTGWQTAGGAWYYLGSDGAMRTGWQLVNGTWYYLGTSGAMRTGWQQVNGARYYLDGSGAMRTGWVSLGGAWYYLGTNGAMRTGWQLVSGTWYYLGGDGVMRTGWVQLSGTWYYLGTNGAMRTGTQLIDGRYSQFATSGAWIGYTTAPAATPATTPAAAAPTTAARTAPTAATTQGLHPIMAAPTAARGTVVNEMIAAYQASGVTYPSAELGAGGAATLWSFTTTLYDEAVAEGVSPELLFAQVMKETGWLQFGGDVTIGQLNFGGLGATGAGNPGSSFPDVRTGLRAQVQHLRAYADATVTTATLHNPVVDPRFGYVRKGSAPYVEYLGIKENPTGAGWAAAAGYGTQLVADMERIFG